MPHRSIYPSATEYSIAIIYTLLIEKNCFSPFLMLESLSHLTIDLRNLVGKTSDSFRGVSYTVETYTYSHKAGWGAIAKCSGPRCKSVVLETNNHDSEASAHKEATTKAEMHILRHRDK